MWQFVVFLLQGRCAHAVRAACTAGLPLVDWRVFPLPLTNVGDLKLPDVSASNASSSAAAAPAGGAAGASAAFQASATPEAACGAEPAATGTATAPSPAIAGPTFYRCAAPALALLPAGAAHAGLCRAHCSTFTGHSFLCRMLSAWQ